MKKTCDTCIHAGSRICSECHLFRAKFPTKWFPRPDFNPSGISERAVCEIMRKTKAENRSFNLELDRLLISSKLLWSWTMGQSDPAARFLRDMALRGYDIDYILTGRRTKC